jgi:hypothetical protein
MAGNAQEISMLRGARSIMLPARGILTALSMRFAALQLCRRKIAEKERKMGVERSGKGAAKEAAKEGAWPRLTPPGAWG